MTKKFFVFILAAVLAVMMFGLAMMGCETEPEKPGDAPFSIEVTAGGSSAKIVLTLTNGAVWMRKDLAVSEYQVAGILDRVFVITGESRTSLGTEIISFPDVSTIASVAGSVQAEGKALWVTTLTFKKGTIPTTVDGITFTPRASSDTTRLGNSFITFSPQPKSGQTIKITGKPLIISRW